MTYCYHCMTKIDDDSAVFCPECGNKCRYHLSQSNELPAGAVIGSGRYLVGKSIGSGGFGITYVGRDLNVNKKVLIKETFYSGFFHRNCYDTSLENPFTVTYQNDISFDRIISKTRKECENLSSAEALDNIVKVYDFFSENNTTYLITEFIDGVTLLNKIRSDGYYKWEELYPQIKPLMQSLSELHDMGILHRDIKPANIMLKSTKHSGEKFFLIDFGLAHSLSASAAATTGLAFSPGYSPVEQRTFSGVEGTFIDVYSLAATIYFALTGENPIQSSENTVDSNFPSIGVLTSDYGVPENVAAVLRSALNSDYKKRCQTISEMLAGFDKTNHGTNKPTTLKRNNPKNVSDSQTLKKDNFDNKEIKGLKLEDIILEEILKESVTKKKKLTVFPIALCAVLVCIGVLVYFIFSPEPKRVDEDDGYSRVLYVEDSEEESSSKEPNSRKDSEENENVVKSTNSEEKSSQKEPDSNEEHTEKIDYKNLVGISKETAIEVLKQSDVQLSYLIYNYNNDYAEGHVFKEEFVEDNTKVNLFISKGELKNTIEELESLAAIVEYEDVEIDIPNIFYFREDRTESNEWFYTYLDFPDTKDCIHLMRYDGYADYWTKEYVDEYYTNGYPEYSGAKNYKKFKIDGHDAISYYYYATNDEGDSFTQYDYFVLFEDHTVEIDIRDVSKEHTALLMYAADSIKVSKG